MKHPGLLLLYLLTVFTCLLNHAIIHAQEARKFPPLPEAVSALTSDAEVSVTEISVPEWEADSNYYYAFEPTAHGATIGFIIYPGAYVDPRSYAPFAHEIARKGFPSFIVKMINDLAIGPSAQRATRVISDHTEIDTWVIGGHSMGAFGGCAYAKEHTDTIDGVVLWAGYPSEIARLDATTIKAVSIYGTNDGICTLDEIEISKQHLPSDAQFIAIEGGNHTQFGWYDTSPDPVQPGDNGANITRQQQQDQIIRATADFLDSFTTSLCPLELLYGRDSKEVLSLRHLRNSILSKSSEGKKIIGLYYQWGPYLTQLMLQDKEFRLEVKKMIDAVLPSLTQNIIIKDN